MRLEVRLDRPGCADGRYAVQAKGFLLAALRWADARGPLPDWTALAYVPLDASGRGCFRYSGGRGIPPGATHLSAEAIAGDFARRETALLPLPAPGEVAPDGGECVRFAIMSDLHLSSRPGRIRRALRLARQSDCALIPGDLTNDGTPEQFDAFARMVSEELPGVPVLAVTGNHDYPVRPLPLVRRGVDDWPSMQRWLLERAGELGVACEEAPCGAYAAAVKGVRIYGLNSASHWRRFVFPEGAQLNWLEERLREGGGARVVLCHAPLLDYNPVRDRGREQPYLSRNDRLQEIVDAAGGVIFVSGHTHIALSEASGCVAADRARGNVYINDSSVAPAMLRTAEAPAGREWVDGAVLYLTIDGARAELAARCVTSESWISRGYYRLDLSV